MKYLLRNLIDGEPAIAINRRCSILRKGLAGGFQFKRVQVAGDVRYHDKPDKNKYSHVCEALEYDIVSGGEDRMVTTTADQRFNKREQYAQSEYDEFSL